MTGIRRWTHAGRTSQPKKSKVNGELMLTCWDGSNLNPGDRAACVIMSAGDWGPGSVSQQKMSLFVCNNINPPDVVFHISAEVSAGTPQRKQLFLASFPQLNTNSESYSELHTITQRKCCRTTVCSGAAISLAFKWSLRRRGQVTLVCLRLSRSVIILRTGLRW